jgi:hypothetical protein
MYPGASGGSARSIAAAVNTTGVHPSADVAPCSPVDLAVSHTAQVANEIFETVLDLRRRLQGVLNPVRPEPPNTTPSTNGKPEPPQVPLVAQLVDVTATQHRTLDVLRALQNDLAL